MSKILKDMLETIDREGEGLGQDPNQGPRGELKVGNKVKANGKSGKLVKFGGDAVYVLHPGQTKATEYDISEVVNEALASTDKKLFESELKRYGLIMDLDGGIAEYDEFDSTEVYIDKISMQKAIIGRFVDWSNEVKGTKLSKAVAWKTIKDSDEFEEWKNAALCWVVDAGLGLDL